MAGLRNLLVHEYAEVNYDIVVSVLNEGLEDFEQFAEYIYDYISKY